MNGRTLPISRRLRPALASVAAASALLLGLVVATTACEAGTTDPNAPVSSDPNARSSSDTAKPSATTPPATAKPAGTTTPAAPAGRVFTNKDLTPYRSARSAETLVVDMNAVNQAKEDAAAAEAAEASQPSLHPDEKARRMAELQDGIKEAESRIAAIDKQAAFMANPYLPPPQLTPEEVNAMKGMSQKEAYLALQAEKATLTEKLAGLRADLATVIATPTRARSTPAVTNPAAFQQAPPP